MKTLHVLAIGNSFSRNAMTHLHQIAESDGVSLHAANLFIGGCSLEQHHTNLVADAASYEYDKNGKTTDEIRSIRAALTELPWDVVTMQQCSGLSGVPESYEPHLSAVYKAVCTYAPDAKPYIHETWAYECDASRPQFPLYNRSQKEMHERLRACYKTAAETCHAGFIPVGEVIRTLRQECPHFIRENGGIPLTVDGFHLTAGYGCYAASLTWYATLTSRDVRNIPYRPSDDADESILAAIRKTVHAVTRDYL